MAFAVAVAIAGVVDRRTEPSDKCLHHGLHSLGRYWPLLLGKFTTDQGRHSLISELKLVANADAVAATTAAADSTFDRRCGRCNELFFGRRYQVLLSISLLLQQPTEDRLADGGEGQLMCGS